MTQILQISCLRGIQNVVTFFGSKAFIGL